jgi:predicted ribosome quality control (RQC) complex YloA/Tae2 family protein
MKFFYKTNYKFIVGSNEKENWKILSDSKPHDVFFHLSSFPSCFLIIDNNTENYPEYDILLYAATICKNNTKYRNLNYITVDYTFCNNVIKGDKVGEIYYKSNKKVLKIKF